jgi:cell division protein FtsW
VPTDAPTAAAPPATSGGARRWTLGDPFAALHGLLARPLASYYLLVSSAGLLLAIGLVMVYSATSVTSYEQQNGNAFAGGTQQLVWAGIGLVGFWVAQRLPVRTYRWLGLPLLVVCLLLAALLALFPEARIGPLTTNLNWIQVGGVQFQPAELAKLALVWWGANLLVRRGDQVVRWKRLAMPLFPVTALLFLLVGVHDLGSMLCLLLIFLGLLWVTGVRFRVFAGLFGVATAGIMVLIAGQSYRLARLLSFTQINTSKGCSADQVMGSCWQSVQGMYALADGGWFGVGLGQSEQKWGYLPEAHNDFIFAIIGEELGVIGCVVVLALFAVLAYAGLRIARRVGDPYRRTVAAACTMWLAGQAVINIGAVVGLLPITGIPLPFISAGGTALVVTLVAVGMLASFARAEPDAARALHARTPGRASRLLWAPFPPLPPRTAQSAHKPPRQRSGRSGTESSPSRDR